MRQASRDTEDCRLGCLAGPFFDGELAPREVKRYLGHLSNCPVCRAELRAVRRLSQLIRDSGSLDPWDSGPEDVLAGEAERAGPARGEAEPEKATGRSAGRPGRERPALKPRPCPTARLAFGAAGGGPCGRAR